jgi:ferredoxin
MKVIVDESLCVGTANCVADCPDLYEIVDGISKVKVAEVPKDQEECARQSVEDCPMDAISIEE